MTDTEDFASRQQRAAKLAKEIESGERAEVSAQLDEAASEEDKYSAVVRPEEKDELPPLVEESQPQLPQAEEMADESSGTARGGWCA